MPEQRFDVHGDVSIRVLRCDAELAVSESRDGDLALVSPSDGAWEVSRDEQAHTVTLTIHRPTRVFAPSAARLAVEQASGKVEVREIRGAVSLRGLEGGARLERLGGDVVCERGADKLVARDLGGGVTVEGWDGDVELGELAGACTVGGVAGDLSVENVGGAVGARRVSGGVRVERVASTVQLDGCGSDLRLREVQGNLAVTGPVGGDARIEACSGGAALHSVGGNLRVLEQRGPLVVAGSVGGNVSLGGTSGRVALRTVGSSLKAVEVRGPLVAGAVGGDAAIHEARDSVEIGEVSGGIRILETGGDVTVQGPVGADVSVHNARGPVVVNGGVAGSVRVGHLHSGLRLRQTIGGDLVAREVRGGVEAAAIAGSCKLVDVAGAVRLDGGIAGSLVVKDQRGSLDAATVNGDAKLDRAQAEAHLDEVSGQLQVARCASPVRVGTVHGGARVGSDSDVTLGAVSGDLIVARHEGNLTCESVHGQATVVGVPPSGAAYRIMTEGSVLVFVPNGARAELALRSDAGTIRCPLPLRDRVEDGHTLRGSLGDGGGLIDVHARGDVRVGAADEGQQRPEGDFADLGRYIGETVSRTMRSAFSEISGESTATLQREMDRAFERARRTAERATARLTEQAERARERAERRMGQGWYGKGPRGWRPGPGSPEDWSKWAEGWYAKGRGWIGEATDEAVRSAMDAIRGHLDADTLAQMGAKIEAELRREFGRAFGPEGPANFRRFRPGRRDHWWPTPGEGGEPEHQARPHHVAEPETPSPSPRADRPIGDWPPRPDAEPAMEGTAEPAIPSTQEARRMAILQQLRDGRITIEEAERRLDEIAKLDR